MKIKGSVALVTGANRGLGLAFATALLAAGASKVYAGARDPSTVPARPGLVPVRLDITNAEDVAAAARDCADVALLINNAGIAQGGSFLSPDGVDAARSQLDTNFFGTLAMARAFAPVLRATPFKVFVLLPLPLGEGGGEGSGRLIRTLRPDLSPRPSPQPSPRGRGRGGKTLKRLVLRACSRSI